jgi:hypothetical protein
MKNRLKIEDIIYHDSKQLVEILRFMPEDIESKQSIHDRNLFDAHLLDSYEFCNDECEARQLFENDRVIVKNDIIIKFLEKENVI